MSMIELIDELYKLQLMDSEKKLLTTLVALDKLHSYGGFSYQYTKLAELNNISLYDFEAKLGYGNSMRHFGSIVSDFWNYVAGARVFDYIDFAWSNAPTLNEIISMIIQYYKRLERVESEVGDNNV